MIKIWFIKIRSSHPIHYICDQTKNNNVSHIRIGTNALKFLEKKYFITPTLIFFSNLKIISFIYS